MKLYSSKNNLLQNKESRIPIMKNYMMMMMNICVDSTSKDNIENFLFDVSRPLLFKKW